MMCTLTAWFFAQFLKVVVTLVRERRFEPKILLFSLGGMPSSHSASVCALCTACTIEYGFGSKVINKLVSEIFSGDSEVANTALKELVGHTPVQVFVGAFVGIGVPFIMMLFMK